MASEDEDKDEKRGFFSIFGGSSAGNKSFWWLPFAFIFLFLAVGGFYAWNTMKGAAHKLVGGDTYNSLSANSVSYGGLSSSEKEDNFFASDEEMSAQSGKKAEKAGLETVLARAGAAGGGGRRGGAAGDGNSAVRSGGAAVYNWGGGQSNALQSKLQARGSALAGMKGGQTSQSTAFNDESDAEKPSVVPIASTGKTLNGQSPKKGPGTSVLESLKSAFKSSLYGARLASQDAASAWIAKSFTAAPEEEMALQYDDKMRSKLDKVNPESIPKFLRDQDINATEAKTLGVSDVHKPDLDKEATKDSLKEDKDYQAKKAAKDMSNGMLNPMFGGFGGTSQIGSDTGTGTDNLNVMSDPNATQDLSWTVDEYGNTIVPQSDGTKQIYDGQSGMILGCEDPKAQMCTPAGMGSCPGDLAIS
ncbi:MAG: hypothetical protein NTX59_01595 [Elusimicrobia bacterium]|nr:hypothetical protein [Elusimicrobiota bacterium]